MASKDQIEGLAVSEASNHLALCMYKLLAKERTNLFFSPFSVSSALAMLFCGSVNETADEMRQVLGYKLAKLQDKDVSSSFCSLSSTLKANANDYILACANLVLNQKEFTVKDVFRSLLEESFEAKIQEVDFMHDTANAVQQVNDWVREKTNNMIPKLLDTLDKSTVMILLNAIYFKGLWLNPFKKDHTRLQTFYNKGDKLSGKQIEMMHMMGCFPYLEEKSKFPYLKGKSFKALQLPYEGNDISMLILLPNSGSGLQALESSLNSASIRDILQNTRERKVDVALPKFRLEYSKSLKEHFQTLGMRRLFSLGANFGGISDSKIILVSDILHKAVVEVNEEGSEAAAVTGGLVFPTAVTVDPEFIVDHPFLFIIYHTRVNLILFMGRVDEL